MNTLEEIKTKLKTLGVAENETDGIIEDVMQLIAAAALKTYVSKLSPEQKLRLESLPEPEVVKYIEDNKNDFPPMPQEEFERIYQETWNNYFNILTK